MEAVCFESSNKICPCSAGPGELKRGKLAASNAICEDCEMPGITDDSESVIVRGVHNSVGETVLYLIVAVQCRYKYTYTCVLVVLTIFAL